MAKARIIETNEGIQDPVTVEVFDAFARTMRDKGWNNVDEFIKSGITGGNALEIGPGPGYVGLEWLKQCQKGHLTGIEISAEMICLAEKNAAGYGLSERTRYIHGNCMDMPFPDASFDAVFSNGSLHEWEESIRVFDEIHRVLKPGGRFCIADMRRDVSPLLKWLIYWSTKPKAIRPGFLTSLNAAYTAGELDALFKQSKFRQFSVQRAFFGLVVSGEK